MTPSNESHLRGKIEMVNVLGMELERWILGSCRADFGVDEKEGWATLYFIESGEQGKGHATELLRRAKKYYEKKKLRFGGSVALNPTMRHIYQKLKIKEYCE